MSVICSKCGKVITDSWYWTDNNDNDAVICIKCGRKGREKSCVVCGQTINNNNIGVNYCGKDYCGECVDSMYKKLSFYKTENNTQSAKADNGKPNLSLVPKQIIYEMEKVRAFGVNKYKDPENWRKVEIERYHQALLRHTLVVWDDINARDEESGLLHLSHIATNIAFILELMNDKE